MEGGREDGKEKWSEQGRRQGGVRTQRDDGKKKRMQEGRIRTGRKDEKGEREARGDDGEEGCEDEGMMERKDGVLQQRN